MVMSENSNSVMVSFLREKHIKYCIRSLQILPEICDGFDSTRLVVAFFAISSLDLLNSLSKIEDEITGYIDWIYYLQVPSDKSSSKQFICGFRGSTPCTIMEDPDISSEFYDKPHLAMTYTALASLLILGDDLKKVDRKGIIDALKELQLPNGSFRPMYDECENDMRFIYCASCISYILHDWSGMDVDRAIQYIRDSITYEGGIAQGPGLEAHGGSTFCAIASLWLMGKLKTALTHSEHLKLMRWCLFRQTNKGQNNLTKHQGFQGRPNKPVDTCYSFWIGATLRLLDVYHESYSLFHHEELRQFIFSCQDDVTGGIAKWDHHPPDPLHTYLGISGLSLIAGDDLIPVHPALNISQKAAAHLANLHKLWNAEEEEGGER